MTRTTGTLHKTLCTFMIIFRSILLGMTNVSKLKSKPKRTFCVQQIFPRNRSVYQITWKKHGTARQATDDNLIRGMRTACRIAKATDTHSDNVTLILLLHGKRGYTNEPQCSFYTYIACLVEHLLRSQKDERLCEEKPHRRRELS